MRKTVQIGTLLLGEGIPKICIPVTAADQEQMQAQIQAIRQSGCCDLVEWRADYYNNSEKTEVMQDALQQLEEGLGGLPILFTFRTKEEGGERSISMEDYEALNEAVARSGKVALIDVERNRGSEAVKTIVDKVKKHGVKTVISYHDFSGTPDQKQMVELLCDMQKSGADVTKLAVMPQNRLDVLALLGASVEMLEQRADRPFITMAMGKLGAVSRLAGALTGSAVTFATAGHASAPGQLDAALLSKVLPMLGKIK